MIPRIAEARYVQDYMIHLRFADGADIAPEFLYEKVQLAA